MFNWIASVLRLLIATGALMLVESAFPRQVDIAPGPMAGLVLGIVLIGLVSDSRGVSSPFSRGVRDSASSLILLTGTRWLEGGVYVSFWAALVVAFIIGLAAMFIPIQQPRPKVE